MNALWKTHSLCMTLIDTKSVCSREHTCSVLRKIMNSKYLAKQHFHIHQMCENADDPVPVQIATNCCCSQSCSNSIYSCLCKYEYVKFEMVE